MRHPQEPTPAEVYEQYLGPTISDPWTQVLLEYAAPQPGEHVLDVACGTGSVARHVAPMVDTHGKIVALDVNPDMLAVASARPAPAGATIAWQQANAVSLGLADGAFDLVLCQQGLQFFPDRAASVHEMRRVLTNGGRVAISVWQALDRHPVFEALLTATARHLGATLATVSVPFSLRGTDELRALLSDAGFQRIDVIPRSLIVHLPAPERFVQLTVMGAATSIPAFAQLDGAARCALVEAVTEETQSVARRYLDGDTLTFPMHTHIAMAYASSTCTFA